MEQNIKKLIIDDGEQSYQDVVSKLKFIAFIKEGQKIDIHTLSTMEDNYWTSLWRTWRTTMACPESRDVTMKWIKKVINDAFSICSKFARYGGDDKENEIEFYQRLSRQISDDIQYSKTGIINLKKTYSDDIIYTSKIDALIVVIDEEIDRLAKTYPGVIVKIVKDG
jgi:hypothetical protein